MRLVKFAAFAFAATAVGWAIGGASVILLAARHFRTVPLDDDPWLDSAPWN